MSGGVPKRVLISKTQSNTPSKSGRWGKPGIILCNGARSRRAMCNYIMRRTRKNVAAGDSTKYPWWYNNPAVLAAANLLASHFSSLPTPEILVLVGISETLAGDLGPGTPVSDTMKHYARGDDTPHAADNYDDLPSQELKNAVDLLNSMRIRAAVPSNILGGAKGPMRVQRHIVGTVHQAGLTALTQPVDPDDKIGYEMPLSSTRNIWVLGGVGDITGEGGFVPNAGAPLTSSYWHLTFDFTGYTGVPGGFSGETPSSDPSPGRFFRIWWKSTGTRTSNPCECGGATILGGCVDPIRISVCSSEPTYWVKFVANNTNLMEDGSDTASWANDGDDPASYWFRIFFNEDLCPGTSGTCRSTPTQPSGAAMVKIHPTSNTGWDNTGVLDKILQQMFFALNAQGAVCNPICDTGYGVKQTPYFELEW